MTTTHGCGGGRSEGRRAALRIAALGAAALLFGVGSACSGIQTDTVVDDAADLSSYRTYAWSTEAQPDDLPGEAVADQELSRQVRDAVDARLAALRFTEVRIGEADLLVGHTETVREEVQVNDPYFSVYPSKKYEVGTVAVDLVDRATGTRVWRGIATARLRYSARGVGVATNRYVETDADRNWQVEDKVRAIFARFPTR